MRLILVALFLGSAVLEPRAVLAVPNGDDHLDEFQLAVLNNNLEIYLNGERRAKSALDTLSQLRPWLASLHGIVLAVKQRLDVRPVSVRTVRRASKLLTLAAAMAERSPLGNTPFLRLSIANQLRPLLADTSLPKAMHLSILRIFDCLQLWNAADFWYVKKQLEISDSSTVNENAHRVHWVMRWLNDEQMGSLAEVLRRHTQTQSMALFLLLETGRMKERELMHLFGLVSQQFARVLERRVESQDEDFLSIRLAEPRHAIVAGQLAKLMEALKTNHPVVRSAFTKAFSVARWGPEPTDYRRRDRLVFFLLLGEGRLDWFDRRRWTVDTTANIAQLERSFEAPLSSLYRVEGNVILVDFRLKNACADDLE